MSNEDLGSLFMNDKRELKEDVILSWIRLTGMLKNTRLTRGMIYNEATIMLLVTRKYREDGEGLVSFKDIVHETKMLKSLVNRTIDSLVAKGFLERCDGETDRRTTYVRPVVEKLTEYFQVHDQTLEMVGRIIEIIGDEDAEAVVRLTNKLFDANFTRTDM